MVDAVPNFRESPLFTPAEKAAMRLADAMAGDHKHAPFDEIFAELRKHYTEEQIVECAIYQAAGFARLLIVLGLEPAEMSTTVASIAMLTGDISSAV